MSKQKPRRRLTEEHAAAKYLGRKPGQTWKQFLAEWNALDQETRRRILTEAEEKLNIFILPSRTKTIDYTLAKYALPGEAKAPILFLGPSGTGKTRSGRRFARLAGFTEFIEVGGHRGMESFDLLGQTLLGEDGTTIWKDGPLAQAFRLVGCTSEEELEAAVERGNTVLLLIDEIFRIPVRERELFLNALQPERIRGVLCYKLRTSRPLPSGGGAWHDETVLAPAHLLSIVATTNVGMEYDVEEDCLAGRERWVARYVYFDENEFMDVVSWALQERKFRGKALAGKFLTLHRALENARRDNQLTGALSLRTARRIIENAVDVSDLGATAAEVLEICVGSSATGEPLSEQLDTLTTIIRRAGFRIESC